MPRRTVTLVRRVISRSALLVLLVCVAQPEMVGTFSLLGAS